MAAKKTSAGPPEEIALDTYVAEYCAAPNTRKAVNDLSKMLAHVVGWQIQEQLAERGITAAELEVGHRAFGGSIRRHHLDAWVANAQYGLQLGLDVKGLNSTSSLKKNWNNRVGDLHELSANHHQHNPKAVMGGVLAIPSDDVTTNTLTNIERAMRNLGGRRIVTNAHNLLEVSCLLIISKEDGTVRADIPDPEGPLRIERFATQMAELYEQRWT